MVLKDTTGIELPPPARKTIDLPYSIWRLTWRNRAVNVRITRSAKNGVSWTIKKKLLFIDGRERAVCFSNGCRTSHPAVDESHFAKEPVNAHSFNYFVTNPDLDFALLDNVHQIARLTYFKNSASCRVANRNRILSKNIRQLHRLMMVGMHAVFVHAKNMKVPQSVQKTNGLYRSPTDQLRLILLVHEPSINCFNENLNDAATDPANAVPEFLGLNPSSRFSGIVANNAASWAGRRGGRVSRRAL